MTGNDDRIYWHVVIYREGKRYTLRRKKGTKAIDVTPYLLPPEPQRMSETSNRRCAPLSEYQMFPILNIGASPLCRDILLAKRTLYCQYIVPE